MAMGIVSDDDFNREKNNLTKKVEVVIPANSIIPEVLPIERGRGKGNLEVPNSLRNIIGETSITSGRQEAVELAKQFGISESSASAYANGATSTASYNEKPNGSIISQAKERISKRARGKLLLALNQITEDKFEGAKLRDIAGIARDMSVVVKNMEESNKDGGGDNKPTVNFVFYAPQTRDEKAFGEPIYTKE
jgi:hypothetical protein